MRLHQARIKPVSDEELSKEQTALLNQLNEAARNLNLFRTTLHDVDTMKGMLSWSNYVGSKKLNSVPWREKELIILRTSYLCKSGYEWSHHAYLGRQAGLNREEIDALRGAGEHYEWSEEDATLIAMCDELVADNFVGDATWESLDSFFSDKQKMDAVYTAAHYGMVAKFANTFGVQIDKGVSLEEGLSAFSE